MQRVEVQIPFCGFHYSWIDSMIDSEVESFTEHLSERLDDKFPALGGYQPTDRELCDSIFSHYKVDRIQIARDYSDEFFEWLSSESGEKFSGEFSALDSPREYNFATDRIFATMAVSDLEKMRDEIPPLTLQDAFKKQFASRSGFASFYDPIVPEQPLSEWDHNETGTLLLAYACYLQDVGFDEWDDQHIADSLGECVSKAIAYDMAAIERELLEYAVISGFDLGDVEFPIPRCTKTPDLFA